MRGMSWALRVANALVLVALATLVVLEPTTALLLGIVMIPLALALVAGIHGNGTVLRGAAIGANALCALPLAMLLLYFGAHLVLEEFDVLKALQFGTLFVPVLVLNLLNMRALVGPPHDEPASRSDGA
jgi:hypothetical protein